MPLQSVTQAVLLCGGLGTRLRPLTDTLPKPMVPIHEGKPFLHYLLEQLSEQGFKRFVLLTGYLSHVIVEYFGDGRKWGWEITYSEGPVEWDTGRRLWEARQLLDERFMLLYSDNFAAFSLSDIWKMHQEKGSVITLLLKQKDTGNVSLGPDGVLEEYDPAREKGHLNFVELGYMIVERDPVLAAYAELPNAPDLSFSSILKYFADRSEVSGRILETNYYSISDPKRLELMRKLLSPRKILLLDRDGTLHLRAPRGEYIAQWKDVQLLPEAIDGLRALALKGFTFVVISNQAGIGRGVISEQDVHTVNENIQKYFQSIGVEILAFYICPHHWDDNCRCRKPRPGLFFDCADDYDLRLDRVLYIGDDPRDCEAAKNAGTRCLYVGEKKELIGGEFEHQKTYSGILGALPDIIDAYNLE
jgi:histidinol-phosphate phosphatase family protein